MAVVLRYAGPSCCQRIDLISPVALALMNPNRVQLAFASHVSNREARHAQQACRLLLGQQERQRILLWYATGQQSQGGVSLVTRNGIVPSQDSFDRSICRSIHVLTSFRETLACDPRFHPEQRQGGMRSFTAGTALAVKRSTISRTAAGSVAF